MVGQFETVFQSGSDKLQLVTIKIEVLEQLNLVLRQNQPLVGQAHAHPGGRNSFSRKIQWASTLRK